MLQNHLNAIKGFLITVIYEKVHDIMSTSKGDFNYEDFFLDAQPYMQDILNIKTLDDLDRFLYESDFNEAGITLESLYKDFVK